MPAKSKHLITMLMEVRRLAFDAAIDAAAQIAFDKRHWGTDTQPEDLP